MSQSVMGTATVSGSVRDTLKHSNLFQGLSDDELDKVLPLCREEVFESGVAIFLEGGACSTMYVVESGKVALELSLHISRTTEENATIAVVTQGGCLCHSGLIDPYILTATGRTLERTKVIAFDTTDLRRLFEDNPELGRKAMLNLAKVVSSRLQRARETMGRILSAIFHDLKTPLAAVESYNRLLLGSFVGELNEEQKNIVQRSSKRLSELLDLVSNMIDFSRIEFGDLRTERVSMARTIAACVDTMRPLADEKGLQLAVEVVPKLSDVLGGQDPLKQVVTNLLSNAIKFTPSGGVVTIRAKDEGDNVRVEVLDTGIGIPGEELPKIFDDFYRGLDIAERGAGLGLSITKRIVEAHHGRIWTASPCPGSGTGSKFAFTLPKLSESISKEDR
ncbi:MAG: HAMP domain-containing histidine kinase [Dehalococcoidia bacterium]|nr:HAMP domain-containing histidine kinase [Dehalococcoidia bacterium]